MGGGRDKKRKFSKSASENTPDSNHMGIGATLAHLRAPLMGNTSADHDGRHEDEEGWQVVSRGGKKQKKTNYPELNYSDSFRMQNSIKISDLQSLVLYCLADGTSPQWVAVRHHKMIKKAVVLFVPGLEKGMFDGSVSLQEDTHEENGTRIPPTQDGRDVNTSANVSNGTEKQENYFPSQSIGVSVPDEYLPTKFDPEILPLPLQPFADVFPHVWPVKAPGDDRYGKVHSPLQAMLQSPIPKSKEEKWMEKKVKGLKPVKEGKGWESKRTRVTEFITGLEELLDNDYTLHPACFETVEKGQEYVQIRNRDRKGQDDGWLDTNVPDWNQGTVPEKEIQQGSITAGRSIFAVDCEMCRIEGGDLALTRISLINWDGQVVMDELVKPRRPIIDYLTPFSGMTAVKLDPVKTTLEDIQQHLLSLLTARSILVGHSLNSDLCAMKLTHPFIIDTSIIFPHPRGPPMKSSLKWLAQKYLSREIQRGHGTNGHDSVEDARACLDLVKVKCEKGPSWGTSEAANESIFKRLKRTKPSTSQSTTSPSTDGLEGAIIDHGSPEKNFGTLASYCIGCSSDLEVVDATKRAVLGDPDGSYIPGGGVSFTWARMREIEHIRGWRNDEIQPPTSSPPPPNSPPNPDTSSATSLPKALTSLVARIRTIHTFLPPCTLFVIYTGTGDPRDMARLQEMQRTFKREYREKKWDELSVKWTDKEEQALRQAVKKAREGMGLICVT